MSLISTAEELHNSMMIRQRLIERAKRELDDGFTNEAVGDVLLLLEHVQRNDERLIRLHAECHGLLEYCTKVLAGDAMRRPVSIVVDPETLSGRPADR